MYEPGDSDNGWVGFIAGGFWAVLAIIGTYNLLGNWPSDPWQLLSYWWIGAFWVGVLVVVCALAIAWGKPALCSFGNWLGRP